MNIFAFDISRGTLTKHIRYRALLSALCVDSIDAFRSPLSESSSADNRGIRLRLNSIISNSRGRPSKRLRIDLSLSSSLSSSQVSNAVSNASFLSPSSQNSFIVSQDTSNTSKRLSIEEVYSLEFSEDLLQDSPDDFFQDIELFEDLSLDSLSSLYIRPPQPLKRLQRFIARHPYTEESKRYHLNPRDLICAYCKAVS